MNLAGPHRGVIHQRQPQLVNFDAGLLQVSKGVPAGEVTHRPRLHKRVGDRRHRRRSPQRRSPPGHNGHDSLL